MDIIKIRGARTNNLKNVDIDIPLNKIICITGRSGSGKSSLAFQTLFLESKRRLINSFPTQMKFFWDIPSSIDVDEIFPVLPVWGLAQINPVVGSRPAIVDLLGISELLQKIFFHESKHCCPEHKTELVLRSELNKIFEGTQMGDILHFFVNKSDYHAFYGDGATPIRTFDGDEVRDFCAEDSFYEVFRVKFKDQKQVVEKINEVYEKIKDIFVFDNSKKQFSRIDFNWTKICPQCDYNENFKINESYGFSPYNALGACKTCNGHGMNLVFDQKKLVKDDSKSLKEGAINFVLFSRFEHLYPELLKEVKKQGYDINTPFSDLPKSIWTYLYKGSGKFPGLNKLFEYLDERRYKKNIRIYTRSMQTEEVCGDCHGTRIESHLRSFYLPKTKQSYNEILNLDLKSLYSFFEGYKKGHRSEFIFTEEILKVLKMSLDLGLGNIKSSRKVKTLSSSEYQKSLLVKYLSFKGSGSLFILDEPSVGLDLNEQELLMRYLGELKEQGNSILLVEHSEYIQKKSDEIIIMGPGVGTEGGEVLYQGKFKETKKAKDFIKIDLDKKHTLKISNVACRDVDYGENEINLNSLNWVTGASGTGKTSYFIHGLANYFHKEVYGTNYSDVEAQISFSGKRPEFEKVIVIDSFLGKVTSRSTVGTNLGISPYVRKYYANLAISKSMGLVDGNFSSNTDIGKCLSCEGRGIKIFDMSFMEDIELPCDDCGGMKLKPIYANISDGKYSFNEISKLPLNDLLKHIGKTPKLRKIGQLLELLNLGHLSMEREVKSLSGGERQRLKLLSELQSEIQNGLLVFENISFGLSLAELLGINELFHKLVAQNNTLIVIDQNTTFAEWTSKVIKFKQL